MNKRTEDGLRAMLAAAILLAGLVLSAAAVEAAETAPAVPAGPAPKSALPYIGGELEIIRRAEGRVQRAVLDRLLGAGKGSVRLDRLAAEHVPEALARLAGQEPDSRRLRVAVSVLLEETFQPERLDLIRREIRETLDGYKFDVSAVTFRLRDDAEQAIEDAQFAIYEGSFDKALARARDAIKADPKNVTAYEILGSVYFLMGQKDQARETWTKVMKMDPDNKVVPGFLAKLG